MNSSLGPKSTIVVGLCICLSLYPGLLINNAAKLFGGVGDGLPMNWLTNLSQGDDL